RRRRDRRAHPVRPLPTTATAHLQSLLAIDPPQLLVVDCDALASQQHAEAAIAEPPSLARQGAQPGAQCRVVAPTLAVAHGAALRPEERAPPPLADAVRLARRGNRAPPCHGRHHFFDAMSFSTALSSMASARSFFSRAFSASSVRSRRASDTSRPPN